jgi:hypothetical protein
MATTTTSRRKVGLVQACDDRQLFGFKLWPKQRELLAALDAVPRLQVWALGRFGSLAGGTGRSSVPSSSRLGVLVLMRGSPYDCERSLLPLVPLVRARVVGRRAHCCPQTARIPDPQPFPPQTGRF